MSLKKRLALDLLFVVQVLGITVFYGTRVVRAFESVQGVNLAELITIFAFCLLNAILGAGAYRTQPSRLGWQIVAVNVVGATETAALAITVACNGYHWSFNDTTTIAIAALGSLMAIGSGKMQGLPLLDPLVKGSMAISCKTLPHLMLAAKIWDEGSAGFPGVAMLFGHLMILGRLTQIGFAVHDEGRWDRNRIGAAISDGTGEIAWIIVTIAWTMR